MNTFESKIINPVWNSSKYNNFQHINMWPVRQQSHNKKYFCSKKFGTDISHNPPLMKTEIMPVFIYYINIENDMLFSTT